MREKEIECKDCGKKFESRLQRENHDRLIHDGKSIKKGNELEDVSKIMAGALEKGLSGIGDIFKDNKDKKIMTTQKPKLNHHQCGLDVTLKDLETRLKLGM